MASSEPVLQLTQELIRRASVTPEDAGCLTVIAERLEAVGFRCERMDAGGVSNLWAEWGSGHPVFTFAGHTDVVPTGPLDEWQSDPFDPVIRNGHLYGRGAADMKSSLAAMVVATERFATASKPKGTLTFLLTSDEEGRARDGTKKVIEALDARGEKIDWCLVGEPSSTHELGDTIRIVVEAYNFVTGSSVTPSDIR